MISHLEIKSFLPVLLIFTLKISICYYPEEHRCYYANGTDIRCVISASGPGWEVVFGKIKSAIIFVDICLGDN